MKELTDKQLLLIWENNDYIVEYMRAAIAADRALNAEDHDPLEPKKLESIADPTLRAVCEAYTNTPGGHFMRLQAIAKLVPAPADRDVMRQALEGIANADQSTWDEGLRDGHAFKVWAQSRARHALGVAPTPSVDPPINMVLHCPVCGMQHIDIAEHWGGEVKTHRSHLCVPEAGGCGHIWRPADVPTNGVAAVKTKGKDDSPPAEQQE